MKTLLVIWQLMKKKMPGMNFFGLYKIFWETKSTKVMCHISSSLVVWLWRYTFFTAVLTVSLKILVKKKRNRFIKILVVPESLGMPTWWWPTVGALKIALLNQVKQENPIKYFVFLWTSEDWWFLKCFLLIFFLENRVFPIYQKF